MKNLTLENRRILLLLILLVAVVSVAGYVHIPRIIAYKALQANVQKQLLSKKPIQKPTEGCPVTQLGELLGADIIQGQASSSSGSGAGLSSLIQGGPAIRGGSKVGDVIVAVEGEPTTCPTTVLSNIQGSLDTAKPTATISLTIDRNGKAIKILFPTKLLKPQRGYADPVFDFPRE